MEPIEHFEPIEDEDVALRYLLGDRLVFYENIPTLQQIACHEVALKLWHHYITLDKTKKSREKTDNPLRIAYGLGKNYRDESDKLVTLLNTPRCVEKSLQKSLETIRLEMKNWIRYFREKMFKRGLMQYCVRDFNPNYCVWFQNGKIDYKRTASKMISEGNLSQAQKFVVMCLHGMADEIEQFPMDTLPEYFNRRGFFDFEISYWIAHHRTDVTNVLLELASLIRGEEMLSIDIVMAVLCGNRFYPHAFEYFWNRLGEEDQVSVALKIIPQTWQLQKKILSNMTSDQQEELIEEIPVVLMTNFCEKLNMPDYAFMVWLRVKNLISEEEFASLVVQFYNRMISSENCISILIDIWDSASDRLKNHVAQTQVGTVFDAFLFSKQRTPSSSKFLCRFLSLINAGTRKRLILKEADLLAKYIDNPNFIVDLIDLCLPKDSERMTFKNIVMESFVMRENCVKLINALQFDKLSEKLAFYSSNDHVARELIEELLNSNEIEAKIFIFGFDKWNKLSNFMLEIFSNDLPTVFKLKKQLMLSFSADAVCYWNKIEFGELIKIVEREFSAADLQSYKQTLLRNFQKGVVTSKQFWRYFDGNCVDVFVSWCLNGDEKKVIEFKSLVPVEKIFDDVFANICGWFAINGSNFEPRHLLDKLDEFLCCFCPSHEGVKEFKKRKINELNEYSFRYVWLDSADRAWCKILMWFFENDEDEFRKFQSIGSNDTRNRRKLDLMTCFK